MESPVKEDGAPTTLERSDGKTSPPRDQLKSNVSEDVESPNSGHSGGESGQINIDEDTVVTKDVSGEKTIQDKVNATSPHNSDSLVSERKSAERENEDAAV